MVESFRGLLLALQVKVGKVTSFVGKIFVVRPSTTKTTNILPHRYTMERRSDRCGAAQAISLSKTYDMGEVWADNYCS